MFVREMWLYYQIGLVVNNVVLVIGYGGSQPWSSSSLLPVLHGLDVSLHTWFKLMGRYLVMQKPANDHSFESGVLDQGNVAY